MNVLLLLLESAMALALAVSLLCLLRGPTVADRIVSLDLFTTFAVGFLALLALTTGQWRYLDIGLALGLLGFLGTVGFATLLERGEGDEAGKDP